MYKSAKEAIIDIERLTKKLNESNVLGYKVTYIYNPLDTWPWQLLSENDRNYPVLSYSTAELLQEAINNLLKAAL